jgi:prephenate dehydratase
VRGVPGRAVASARAGRIYGVEVLAERIQTHAGDRALEDALREIEGIVDDLRALGSYPRWRPAPS